jgi:hypothetical protein
MKGPITKGGKDEKKKERDLRSLRAHGGVVVNGYGMRELLDL